MLDIINDQEILFRTEWWTCVLLWKQVYLGSSMLILNRQCDSLAELNMIELVDMQDCFRLYELALKDSFDATMFNYSCLMNHGYQHTPPKPWVHWWMRPRYSKPIGFNGVDFVDQNFGYFYDREAEHTPPTKDFDPNFRIKIVETIHNSIDLLTNSQTLR
jgi:diadenosine tetraphosphate (Ap4A) HIT family hydrolase